MSRGFNGVSDPFDGDTVMPSLYTRAIASDPPYHHVLSLSFSGALAFLALAYSLLLAFKLLTQSQGDAIANVLLATVCFLIGIWSWGFLARDLRVYLYAPHLFFV